MKKISILLIALMVSSAGFLSGCFDSEQKANPKGVINSGYSSTNNDYDNFIIFVNVTVKNIGEDGDLTVWAYVRQGLTMDDKSQTLFFESGETKDVSFAFSEVFQLGSSWIKEYGVNPH